MQEKFKTDLSKSLKMVSEVTDINLSLISRRREIHFKPTVYPTKPGALQFLQYKETFFTLSKLNKSYL